MPDPSTPVPQTRTIVRVWDLPLRLFHWLLAATILVAFLSSEEESALAPWHIPAGWAAAVLIAFRLVWGFVGGEHARFANFLKPGKIAHHIRGLLAGKPERAIGHNAIGGLAVFVLLGTVAGVVYTGATMGSETGKGLHETLSNILLGVIALHVTAVIVISLVTRDNLIRAFVTGKKPAASHPGVPDARPPATLAIPLAAIAIGATTYGATLIDPLAFDPAGHAGAGEPGDGEAAKGGQDDD